MRTFDGVDARALPREGALKKEDVEYGELARLGRLFGERLEDEVEPDWLHSSPIVESLRDRQRHEY